MMLVKITVGVHIQPHQNENHCVRKKANQQRTQSISLFATASKNCPYPKRNIQFNVADKKYVDEDTCS